MAKYVPSGIGVGELRNKAGSSVFARNRFGAYMRTKANPVQPRTTFQKAVRETLTALAQQWRDLTPAQRQGWADLGAQIQRVDPLGQVYSLTGLQAWELVNMRRRFLGLSVLTAAPRLGAVTDLTSATLTITEGPPFSMSVAFSPAIAAQERIAVWGSRAVSQGKNFFGPSDFRLLQVSAPGASSPLDITAMYIARWSPPTPGEKVAIKLEVWSPDMIPGNQIVAIGINPGGEGLG